VQQETSVCTTDCEEYVGFGGNTWLDIRSPKAMLHHLLGVGEAWEAIVLQIRWSPNQIINKNYPRKP